MRFQNRILGAFAVVALLWVLVAAPFTAYAAEEAAGGTGRIAGKVFRADGKTPVAGAIVRACYLEDQREFAAEPTRPDGSYELAGLPVGYADLTVETGEGIYVANQVLNIAPAGKLQIRFTLTNYEERPAAWWGKTERREVPCATKPPSGVADMSQKLRGSEWVKTPAGIAVVAGGSAAALLAIAAGGGNEASASPSQP